MTEGRGEIGYSWRYPEKLVAGSRMQARRKRLTEPDKLDTEACTKERRKVADTFEYLKVLITFPDSQVGAEEAIPLPSDNQRYASMLQSVLHHLTRFYSQRLPPPFNPRSHRIHLTTFQASMVKTHPNSFLITYVRTLNAKHPAATTAMMIPVRMFNGSVINFGLVPSKASAFELRSPKISCNSLTCITAQARKAKLNKVTAETWMVFLVRMDITVRTSCHRLLGSAWSLVRG